MPETLEQLEDTLLALPEASRRRLAERLWESVLTPEELDAGCTAEELAEWHRRSLEVESGQVATYSHEEVMRSADELLRSR